MKESQVGGGRKSPTIYPKGKYKCPKCANRVEVFVNMTLPPCCVKHPTGSVVMEAIK